MQSAWFNAVLREWFWQDTGIPTPLVWPPKGTSLLLILTWILLSPLTH